MGHGGAPVGSMSEGEGLALVALALALLYGTAWLAGRAAWPRG